MLVKSFTDEFARYRALGAKALEQVPDSALNHIPATEGNSLAMIVRHVSGNLKSRFTDFLTSDGEKPWRQRDDEFDERSYSRSDVATMWGSGWQVLEDQLATLRDSHLDATVHIRGTPLSVHEALCRSLAHISYHVGQIVLLARMHADHEWRTLSIPKGKSAEYNLQPTMEKSPR